MTLVRTFAVALAAALLALGAPSAADAAPRRAEIVIDGRTGEVLHARDADARVHPASLTKMMTLYLVFEAIERGRLSLDQQVRISPHAARQAPTKVGFKPGQRVRIRELVRTAALRSANDSAVALAEAVAGSESAFAQLMTRRARDLGMDDTTFRNATGFTASGHLSTARDMAHLGRRLFYDFPEYYGLFGRASSEAFGRTIFNTNKLLNTYRGADGIKTGYTRAAGFNLVASAERGERRVIAALLGGTSSAARNARVAELLDLGFREAPARVREVPPDPVVASRAEERGEERAEAPAPAPSASLASRAAVAAAPRPEPRPGSAAPRDAAVAAAEADAVDDAVALALAEETGRAEPARAAAEGAASLFARGAAALGDAFTPSAAQAAETPAGPAPTARALRAALVAPTVHAPARARAPVARVSGAPRRAPAAVAAAQPTGGDWAVQLGAFVERDVAVAQLAAAAFGGMPALAEAGREIHVASIGETSVYRARLTGLDAATAREACRRLATEGRDCLPIPPAN
jgi:D-alanyl-D-alanine carboxypeptidase